MPKQYYVIQEFSWTDLRCLWRVISRSMKSILSARDWMDSEKDLFERNKMNGRNKNKKWFIVERLSDEEVERRIAAGEQFNLD